ncbi:hypothetical protein CC86DRAFT_377896 [Ophiobolus disseminans]|uniref:C2H2-type domain-containing protein n=1 Tax=Ophiobolus disseminans TaxID=1469910 RepID=A0A6A7ACC4_9PLEO|nr:hypothetical protein CC86DRAFT_377896 [Ophiobolus disseminans]
MDKESETSSSSGTTGISSKMDSSDSGNATGDEHEDPICPYCNGFRSKLHPSVLLNEHTKFDTFKTEVNRALDSQKYQDTYDEVEVILFTWREHDLGPLILRETDELKEVFEEWGFNATHFSIPSISPQSEVDFELATYNKSLSHKLEDGKNVLLIVYYNGHGTVKDRKLFWSPCYAAAAGTKGDSSGVIAVLSGSSRESTAVAPKFRGTSTSAYSRSPFTDSLIKHLRAARTTRESCGLYVSELHDQMANQALLDKQSPHLDTIRGHDELSILLKPLGLQTTFPVTPPPEGGRRALISVNLRDGALPNTEKFIRWLSTFRPQEVTAVRLDRIRIEASHDSDSTLMLISVPVRLWALIRDIPGCALVGFVKSGNRLLEQDFYNQVSAEQKLPSVPDTPEMLGVAAAHQGKHLSGGAVDQSPDRFETSLHHTDDSRRTNLDGTEAAGSKDRIIVRNTASVGLYQYPRKREPQYLDVNPRMAKFVNTGTAKFVNPEHTTASLRFPCILAGYGCTDVFASKNEWRQHISTRHIKVGYWQCDMCKPSEDFVRKDIFTQHLRRTHMAPKMSTPNATQWPVTEDNIAEHQLRCYKHLRNEPTQSTCQICGEAFDGPSIWQYALEHQGRHLEKKVGTAWKEDPIFTAYLLEEGIITRDADGNYHVVDDEPESVKETYAARDSMDMDVDEGSPRVNIDLNC